jgi:Domain of unknown function (DU1801)
VAEGKTKRTDQSVSDFIQGLEDESRRKDCAALVRLMAKAAAARGAMYGPSIIGFGTRTITYAGGRTEEWPAVGFSPRKADLTLYVSASKAPKPLLKQLGKHKVSGSCLHIKRLSDVDLDVLGRLVTDSVKRAKKRDLPG